MTKQALVTGSRKRIEAVGAALEEAGFEVLRAEGFEELKSLATGIEPRTLDAYVQLPVEVSSDAETITGQIEALLAQGILLRFLEAEVILPLLVEDAEIVLVSGNLPPKLSTPDDHHARQALLRVLAHALHADRAPEKLSVTVASSQHSPEKLALIAQGAKVAHPTPPDYAEMWPDMEYDEWRLAILGLASMEG
jgi:hypothetical protein